MRIVLQYVFCILMEDLCFIYALYIVWNSIENKNCLDLQVKYKIIKDLLKETLKLFSETFECLFNYRIYIYFFFIVICVILN